MQNVNYSPSDVKLLKLLLLHLALLQEFEQHIQMVICIHNLDTWLCEDGLSLFPSVLVTPAAGLLTSLHRILWL